jgi:hypothetical protein
MTSSALPWAERPQVRKGDVGELLVDDFLRGKKVIPYRPDYDGAHPFDRLCATADKKTIFVADIKTKARREFYADTGINLNHYGDYKHIETKYRLRVFLFFVDEKLGEIYGNWLTELEQPVTLANNGKLISYPLKQGGILYFPLAHMQPISPITLEKAKELMALSTRSYEYGGINQKKLF